MDPEDGNRDRQEANETGSGSSPDTQPDNHPFSTEAGSFRVLVVDDEPTLRSVIGQTLRMDGFDVTEAACAEDALALYRGNPFSLVITDVIMGDMSGLDLLREIKTLDPEALVVIMTSQVSLDVATEALREGAYDFLVKPFEDLIILSALVERAMDRFQLQARNRLLAEQLKTYAQELERLNKELKKQADRDGLTGVFNRRALRNAMTSEMSRSTRTGEGFAFILLDVDNFKRYNDTHGHLAGDEVLRGLGHILRDFSRTEDVCARYGGEEFALLTPGADRAAALAIAERLRCRVEAHDFSADQHQSRVTISLGVSCYPLDGSDPQALIGHADKALYRAKQGGKNMVQA